MSALKDALWREARDAGFAKMGVCRPDAAPDLPERLTAYVDAGYHGQMGWMAERMHWRGNPAALWPEAKSVIMLAESYAPEHDPLAVIIKRQLLAGVACIAPPQYITKPIWLHIEGAVGELRPLLLFRVG